MGVWRPELGRRMAVMDLATGDTPTYTYTLTAREKKVFRDGAYAFIEFKNSFKQTLAIWEGYVVNGAVTFPDVTSDDTTLLVRGTTFALSIEDVNANVRIPVWGTVTRNEPRYPDYPQNNTDFNAIQYDYDFGTVGTVVDPSWDVKNGAPSVWDNSSSGQPNGVACGILFDDAAMLWYAPFRGDSIEINYSVVNRGAGKSGVAFCSNSDMSEYLCVTHETGLINNNLLIEVGSSPVHLTTWKSVPHVTANLDNYTIRYNSITNTVAVYQGTNLATPVIDWTDEANLVDHGDGHTYYGLNWRASLLAPGTQFTAISAQDAA
ncbi:hypothetical protein [Mycobacterium sp. AZCC_0083]|uniref:hypothetical protein n=1 Tax=Mycobacterium sp. AZCC_0083 TaxID=2735882 RepID=UPI00161B8901|nr:hypothetical protein [Mycobacterium sp. AZCC_0083]MBB5167190.1 hypothetical protein [Mycobacterium sp. AZCC_0083]